MPTTIYGEVDEETLAQQEKELQEMFPRIDFTRGVDVKPEELDESTKGNAYFKSEAFFVAGDESSIPLTNPERGAVMGKQRQGYKIHVSTHPAHAAAVARAVLPLLHEGGELGGTYHKYQNLRSYAYERTGHPGKDREAELQAGKFITIYAANEDHLKQIAASVQNALLQHQITPEMGGGMAPGDKSIGATSLMSMRYGQFSGRKENMVWVNGEFIADVRTQYCPDALKGEFARVIEATEAHMEQTKVGLSMPQVGTSQQGVVQTSPSTSTTTQSQRARLVPPELPPRPEQMRAETSHTQQGASQQHTHRPLPQPPRLGQEPIVSSVRDAMKPQPRSLGKDLLLQVDSHALTGSSSQLSTSQTTPTRPPHLERRDWEATTSTSHTQPPPLPPRPLRLPVSDRTGVESISGTDLPLPMTSHSVGETSGLGARLEKNKRHAMYGVDDTELQELLKQEREKVETSSHTVAKDLGPRQPPTGGQGGASISRGGL